MNDKQLEPVSKNVPQSWLDKPYLKYEGTFNGIPIYSPKQDDLTDEQYAKVLRDLKDKVLFINEDDFTYGNEPEWIK